MQRLPQLYVATLRICYVIRSPCILREGWLYSLVIRPSQTDVLTAAKCSLMQPRVGVNGGSLPCIVANMTWARDGFQGGKQSLNTHLNYSGEFLIRLHSPSAFQLVCWVLSGIISKSSWPLLPTHAEIKIAQSWTPHSSINYSYIIHEDAKPSQIKVFLLQPRNETQYRSMTFK